MSLTTNDMIEVATVFQQAFEHVLGNLKGSDSEKKARQFAAHIVLSEKPYMLVTEEGIQRCVGLIFTNEVTRDFIFTLTYAFLARWGGTPERLEQLAENLTCGAALSTTGMDYAAMPNEISIRLANREDTKKLLVANHWLVTLLLMQLFLAVAGEDKQETK